MKQTKRLCLALAAMLLGIGSTWATAVALKPVNELAFRTSGGVTGDGASFQAPTAWVSGYPKSETNSTNHAIECNYGTEFFAMQMYDVTDYNLNETSSVTLTFQMQNTLTNKLGAWVYPNADWTESSQQAWSAGQCPIVENFKSVVGTYPGHVGTSLTCIAQAVCSENNTIQTFTFTGDALQALIKGAVKKDNKVYLSLIITFSETNASYSKARKPTYYCMTADENKQPVMSFETQEVNYNYPKALYQYRPASDGSKFDGKVDGSTVATVELNNSARIFCVGQYRIPNFDKAAIYNFYFKRNQTNYQDILIFNWPEYKHAQMTAAEANTTFSSIVGFAPGVTTTAAKDSIQTSCYRKNDSVLVTVPGSNITPLYTDAWGYTHVNLLLVNKKYNTSSNSNLKVYSNNATTAVANQPAWIFAGLANIYNKVQNKQYSKLSDAETAAVAGDTLCVNNDITLTARQEIDVAITLVGRTPQTKILRGTGLDNLLLLTKANVTLQDITLDGQSVSRSKNGIECGSNSKLTLKGVTMQNFAPTAGYADVMVTGNGVVLTGTNILPNGIKLNKNKRVQTTSATITSPISLILAADYVSDYVAVQTCSDPTLFTVTCLDGNDWGLYCKPGKTELSAIKYAASITLDESSNDNATIIAAYMGRPTSITLARTIAASTSAYSTFCVPFETTKSELGAAEVLAYTGATIVGEEATLNFEDVETLEAGKPYLVRFDAEYKDPVFTGKTITAATAGKYGDENFEFKGLFSQTKITTDQTQDMMYLGAANQLYWADANCTINGLRGYFEAISAPAVAVRRMSIGRGTATGINHQSSIINHQSKVLRNGQLIIIRDGKQFNAQGQAL